MATLAAWSSAFGWQQRLADEADRQAREIAEAQAAYRRAIMEEGLALDHERVRSLKELAAKLYEELTEGGRLWVTDKKGIGSGNSFEAVDIERFNAAEVEQLRGLLDDIAREKSERAAVQKLQHSGKVEGGSVVILMPDNGRGDREPD